MRRLAGPMGTALDDDGGQARSNQEAGDCYTE